jgi:hypothetical protein
LGGGGASGALCAQRTSKAWLGSEGREVAVMCCRPRGRSDVLLARRKVLQRCGGVMRCGSELLVRGLTAEADDQEHDALQEGGSQGSLVRDGSAHAGVGGVAGADAVHCGGGAWGV